MVKDTKGSLNQHSMHKNRASRQFFFITASSARGRAQPNTPPCPKICRNAQFRYLDTGPCSLSTPPCPAFCLLLVLAVWTHGRAQPTPPRVQLPSNIKSCF
ncbi:hypothetical protein HanIR_Chr14g0675891 [Helianthus annuus]|nr:hypothetical protein HanIR_Chr14g0675891 [Helianthus annuus]